MISSIISNQLAWLGLGIFLLAVSILQKGKSSSQSGITKQRIHNTLLIIGVACLGTFCFLVLVQGVTFYQITSILNFWIVLLAMIGYFAWGSTFIVVGGYLLTLFRDVLSSLNIVSIPTPMSALANFGAPVAVGVIAGLWMFEYYKFKRYSSHTYFPKIFGTKYLILVSVIILFVSPLYQSSFDHLLQFMNIYWFILFIPFFASSNVSKVAKLTTILIITSLILRIYLYTDQILTRPLMFTPKIGYLSATEVDNVFRLGGQTYGANNSSLTLLTLLPFGLALIWKSSWTKMLRPIILLALAYLIYRTDTRTTWVGFIFVLITYFFLIRDRKYVLFTLLGTTIGIVVLPYLSSKMVGNLAQTGGITSTQNNLGLRISMWGFALKSALSSVESWVIGVGWGAEPVPWESFGTSGSWDTLHGLWIASLVHGGLVLLSGWIIFFLKGIIGTWKAIRRIANEYRIWFAAGVASWIGFFFFTLTANADWPQPTQMIVIISLNLWAVSRLNTYKGNSKTD